MNTAVLTGRQVLFNTFFGVLESMNFLLLVTGILTGVATNEDLHCVEGREDR